MLIYHKCVHTWIFYNHFHQQYKFSKTNEQRRMFDTCFQGLVMNNVDWLRIMHNYREHNYVMIWEIATWQMMNISASLTHPKEFRSLPTYFNSLKNPWVSISSQMCVILVIQTWLTFMHTGSKPGFVNIHGGGWTWLLYTLRIKRYDGLINQIYTTSHEFPDMAKSDVKTGLQECLGLYVLFDDIHVYYNSKMMNISITEEIFWYNLYWKST